MAAIRWMLVCSLVAAGCAEGGGAPTPQNASALAQPPTAIEVLIAQGSTLQLRTEQMKSLERLDHKLAVMNQPLEGRIAEVEKGDPQRASKHVNHSTGHDRMTVLSAERNRIAEAKRRAEVTDALRIQMAENHEAVLGEAFHVLDADQREKARPLLEDGGFDAPAGSTASAR